MAEILLNRGASVDVADEVGTPNLPVPNMSLRLCVLECCVKAPLHVLFESSEARSCNAALMHWTSVALPMWCRDGDE